MYFSIIDKNRMIQYLRNTVILSRFIGIYEESFKKYLKIQKVIYNLLLQENLGANTFL